MSKQDEQLTALEKQVTEIEELVAKLVPEDGEGKARKRYRPGDLKKAKKSDDETDDEYSDLEDDNDEDDMEKQEQDKLDKAAAEKAAVEKVAAEKAATEKAAVEKAAADKAAAEKAAIEKGGDESVTIEGQTIKKSAVGPEMFAILKAQSEKIEKQGKELGSERDLRKMAELKKLADDKYPNIPGTVDERANMLKAIETMDEPLRKSFEATLNSAQKLAKMAFDTLGSDGGRDPVTAKAFEGKVAEIKKRDSCTQQEAMQKARAEFPEEFKAYQGAAN